MPADLPALWGSEAFRLHAGLVPLGNDIFRKIVVRASRVSHIDASDFSLKQWTDRWYYEVCTNPCDLRDARRARLERTTVQVLVYRLRINQRLSRSLTRKHETSDLKTREQL